MQHAESRYRGFAQVEYDYVRKVAYPTFDWKLYARPSPRCRLTKPLERARIALVSTAGASVRGQPPFNMGDDGDPTFREIPRDAPRIRLSHPGYNVPRARMDPDVVFPLELLRSMVEEGEIGELAPHAYSFMGYIPETEALLSQTAPQVAERLRAAQVDLVLLVPV